MVTLCRASILPRYFDNNGIYPWQITCHCIEPELKELVDALSHADRATGRMRADDRVGLSLHANTYGNEVCYLVLFSTLPSPYLY